MKLNLPTLFLARHGDTAWTDSGQYTGRTDLPLNARGEERARHLSTELLQFPFVRVFCSPLQRAVKTCALAGFANAAIIDSNLYEWDYGRFEGKLTSEIQHEKSGWRLFRDGCPGGESPQQVMARAKAFISRAREINGNVLAFSSGHIIRAIAACWLGLPFEMGASFFCRPASVGVLGFTHGSLDEPIIKAWNYQTRDTVKAISEASMAEAEA